MSGKLNFILGRADTGKTACVVASLRAHQQNGERAILLVPEQYTYEAERLLAESLGGLLGVLATLVILGVVGGTLNYAPRRLVDAMNDNLAVMQANQETTWSETQALVARADALDRRLSALEGLDDRIAALESGSAETESRLADTVAGLTQMDTQLAELAQSQALMFEEVDGRISGQEREISVLNEAVTSARDTLQGIQDQVARYEAFFDALRSLLDDMQESAATETGA